MRFALAAILLLLACGAQDAVAPTVSQTLPPDGATGIFRNDGITVYFSEAMDEARTAAAFTISPDVAGTKSWFAGRNLIFTPASLDSFAQYTVTIGTGARDLAGNALEHPLTFSFTTGAAMRTTTFYLFGRSVLQGWFSHWGWDGEEATPVQRTRFELHHRYLTGPEDAGANTIADFRAQVNALDIAANPAVFFKLCFVDFTGGDSTEAQANLDRNERLVDSLLSIVNGRGLRAVIGNALPKTESEFDAWLYWNHTRYNAYIDQLAQAHPDSVFVLDMYAVLADTATHCIRHEYRTGADDAHPNESGYDALDPVLDYLLEVHF